MDTTLQIVLAAAVIAVVFVAGVLTARVLQKLKESAPTRTLQAINGLLTAYEHQAINAREVSEAQARQAANAFRYKALEARMASLPPDAIVVPATVTVAQS